MYGTYVTVIAVTTGQSSFLAPLTRGWLPVLYSQSDSPRSLAMPATRAFPTFARSSQASRYNIKVKGISKISSLSLVSQSS